MSGSILRASNLRKAYRGRVVVEDLSLHVESGEVVGLLGPNGAGKSTMINILAGLVMKTGGTANIWGFDIDAHPRNAKRSIGIVPQEILFDPFFTPKEALEIQAGLYGIPKAERRTMELLRAVHLEELPCPPCRSLSRCPSLPDDAVAAARPGPLAAPGAGNRAHAAGHRRLRREFPFRFVGSRGDSRRRAAGHVGRDPDA
jgi:ABC-type oligopeptide transport system ATPase subunit